MANDGSILEKNLLFEQVNQITENVPGNYFSRQEIKDVNEQKQLKKFRTAIHQGIAELKVHNHDSNLCPVLEAKFQQVIYKYGLSSRRMKHWKSFKQAFNELKRFNSIDMIGFYTKLHDGLFKSQCNYKVTKQTIDYMGAMLLKKLIHLDRLRIHCIRTVNLCISVVEMGHLLILLLFLITTLSEVASEAHKWYFEYKKFYLSLAEYFRTSNNLFPINSEEIPYNSEQMTSTKQPKEVLLIRALANAPHDQASSIAKSYLDDLGSNVYGIDDEAVKHLRYIKEIQNEEVIKKVEESILIKDEQESAIIFPVKKKRRR